jgi:hypothetical protein
MPAPAGAWIRAVVRVARSPADLRTALRFWRGAREVRHLKHRMSIADLVARFVGRPSGVAPAGAPRLVDLAWLVGRATRGGGHGNCLERSLVLYRGLGEAGYRPELWFGLRAAGSGREGHVWVVLDGAPAGDDPAAVSAYVPVMVFDASGRLGRFSGEAVPPDSISWA